MASIRRIIRSEKAAEPETQPEQPSSPDPATAPAAGTAAPDAAPQGASDDVLPLTPEMMEEPLPLTPEMQADTADPAPEAGAGEMPSALAGETMPVPAASSSAPAPHDQGGGDALVLDEAAIEAMIRRVLQEELMGPIGQNISTNVQRMIEAEIARRMGSRD